MRKEWIEPRQAVEEAIELLEHVPRTYGGHLSKEGTSTIDGVERTHALHEDGRVLRLYARTQNGRGFIARHFGGEMFVVPVWRLLGLKEI